MNFTEKFGLISTIYLFFLITWMLIGKVDVNAFGSLVITTALLLLILLFLFGGRRSEKEV